MSYLHVVLVLFFLLLTENPVFGLSCALFVFLIRHLDSIFLLILHSVLATLYNFPLVLLLSKFLLPVILYLHAYVLLYFMLMAVQKCAGLLPPDLSDRLLLCPYFRSLLCFLVEFSIIPNFCAYILSILLFLI